MPVRDRPGVEGYMPTIWCLILGGWINLDQSIHSQPMVHPNGDDITSILPQTVGYLKKSQNHQMWVMCGGQGHPN
eukprot:scaffold23476_cov53-Attheya_sp.AAC.7